MTIPGYLAGVPQDYKFSIMDARVPPLIGMDLMTPWGAVVDTGHSLVCFVTVSTQLFACHRLASGHMAINLATPVWWQPVSVPSSASVLALEDDEPAGPE